MDKQQTESPDLSCTQGMDYVHSLIAAMLTQAIPHYCYSNVWHMIHDLSNLSTALLVEGWMVFDRQHQVSVTEHCWCELEDGRILDPSLALVTRPVPKVTYFPGIKRAFEELQQLDPSQLPKVRVCGEYGPRGMGHPLYLAAFQAACQEGLTCASAVYPPKRLLIQPAWSQPDESDTRISSQVISSQNFLKGIHP